MHTPDFTLRQLSYLVATAEEGTVAGAARRLHISPSALSDALTELERTLGEQLCVRRRARGVTMTAAGHRVLTHARQLLAAADELSLSLVTDSDELVGPITIGCYPTLAPTVLPPLLDEFGRAHPRVDLNILETTHTELDGKLDSGEIDVAFVYDALVPGTPRAERLFELPAHVLLAGDDPFSAAEHVRLEDLVDRDLILLDASPSSAHTLSLFAKRGLVPRVRHRTSSYEAVRTLVARGLGYGILVQRPANEASYEGYPVVMKEIHPPVAPVGIEVIWSAERPPALRTRALIEFARSIDWTGVSA